MFTCTCLVACAVTRFEEITPFAQRACVCPGDVLTYECIIAGSGTTVWTGSGFTNCPSQDNQILLLHSTLMAGIISKEECGGGLIIAEGTEINNTVSGNGRCYRSQLNVTVNYNTTVKSVMCIYIADDGPQQVGNSTIGISGRMLHKGHRVRNPISDTSRLNRTPAQRLGGVVLV